MHYAKHQGIHSTYCGKPAIIQKSTRIQKALCISSRECLKILHSESS